MEEYLRIGLNDIPDNLRLILKKGTQTLIVTKAIKKCKGIKTLAKKLKVDRSTIYWWREEWCFMKLCYLKKLLRILDMRLNEIYDKINGVKGEGKIKVFFKQKLPFEIPVELIAHLQGDGSVRKRSGRCSYTNQEFFLVNSFIKSFEECLSTKINIYKGKGYAQVNLPAAVGKILTSKFGSFACKEFVVPKLKNKETIKRYLRTIFDDEGSVVEDKKRYRYISLRLVNKRALHQIREFLSKLGINSHVYERKSELRVSGSGNIIRFVREVGFSHPLQKKKLKRLLNNYKRIVR